MEGIFASLKGRFLPRGKKKYGVFFQNTKKKKEKKDSAGLRD